jgi:hypothetical protein
MLPHLPGFALNRPRAIEAPGDLVCRRQLRRELGAYQ